MMLGSITDLVDKINKALNEAQELQEYPDTEETDRVEKSNQPIQKIDAGSFSIFEKRQPVYMSTIFGIPLLYVGAAGLFYKILFGKKSRGR